jgi:hypothetical protein
MAKHWETSRCMKGNMTSSVGVSFKANVIKFSFWAMWHEYRPHMEKAMPSFKDISNNQEFARWMVIKALGHSINNFTRLANACICIIEENNCDI